MSLGGRLVQALLFVATVLTLQGLGTVSHAHEVTFQLQSETGDPVDGEFTWAVFGPTGNQRVQSSGDGLSLTLADGEYTAIVMRSGAETAQDFTFQVDGADRVISVVLQSQTDPSQPNEAARHEVTIRLSDEPDAPNGVAEYRWRLTHGNRVVFEGTEPTARLQVPLERRETQVSVTRLPDFETARFTLTPAGVAGEVIDIVWADVSAGRLLPEGDAEGPAVVATLDPRIEDGRLVVGLSFEAGAPDQGDALWLEDAAPGALAMTFVEPGRTEVALELPQTDMSDLRVTYRRAQTLIVAGEATVPTQ